MTTLSDWSYPEPGGGYSHASTLPRMSSLSNSGQLEHDSDIDDVTVAVVMMMMMRRKRP